MSGEPGDHFDRVVDRILSFAPPSVRFTRWVAARTRMPFFCAILVTCFAPYLLGLLLALGVDDGIERHTTFWLRLNLFMITAGAFILLELIHRRCQEVVVEILRNLDDPDEIDGMVSGYRFLFAGREQWIFFSLFILPTIASVVFIWRLPFEGLLLVFYIAYAVLTIILTSGGLWVTIGLIALARAFSRCRSLKFNLVEPLNTPGVRELANLSTTWGLCFTLEAIFLVVGIWLCPWEASEEVVFLSMAGWTLFILVFNVITFVYPKMLIRTVVHHGKHERIRWFQPHIDEYEEKFMNLPIEEIERRERSLSLLQKYNDIHNQIAKARVSTIDLVTLLKLVGSLLVPFLIFLLQNPDWLNNLKAVIAWASE